MANQAGATHVNTMMSHQPMMTPQAPMPPPQPTLSTPTLHATPLVNNNNNINNCPYSSPSRPPSSTPSISNTNMSNSNNNNFIRFKLQNPTNQQQQQQQKQIHHSTSSGFSFGAKNQIQHNNMISDNDNQNNNEGDKSRNLGLLGSSSKSSQKSTEMKSSSNDFPPDLQDYVNRAFALSNNDLDKDRIEIILKGKLTLALKNGTLYSKDWKKEPLPLLNQSGDGNKNKSSANTKNLSKPLSGDSYKYKGYFSSPEKSPTLSSSSSSSNNEDDRFHNGSGGRHHSSFEDNRNNSTKSIGNKKLTKNDKKNKNKK